MTSMVRSVFRVSSNPTYHYLQIYIQEVGCTHIRQSLLLYNCYHCGCSVKGLGLRVKSSGVVIQAYGVGCRVQVWGVYQGRILEFSKRFVSLNTNFKICADLTCPKDFFFRYKPVTGARRPFKRKRSADATDLLSHAFKIGSSNFTFELPCEYL